MVRESEVKFSVLAPRAAVVCYVSETGVSQMRGWVGGRYVGTVGFCVGAVAYAVGTVVGTVVFYSRNCSFHEFRLRFLNLFYTVSQFLQQNTAVPTTVPTRNATVPTQKH